MKEKFIYLVKSLCMVEGIGNINLKYYRTPTPIKEIINYDYANSAEVNIRHSYDRFLDEVNYKLNNNLTN